MKRLLTALLLACAVLCGSACGKREPNKIDRDALTETGTGTGASDAGSDHTQLPVYHPLRIEKASKWDGIIQTVASDEQVFTFSHGLDTALTKSPKARRMRPKRRKLLDLFP